MVCVRRHEGRAVHYVDYVDYGKIEEITVASQRGTLDYDRARVVSRETAGAQVRLHFFRRRRGCGEARGSEFASFARAIVRDNAGWTRAAYIRAGGGAGAEPVEGGDAAVPRIGRGYWRHAARAGHCLRRNAALTPSSPISTREARLDAQ